MTNKEKLNEISKIVDEAYYTNINDLTLSEAKDYASDLYYIIEVICTILKEG